MTIYTIGHSNHSLNKLLTLLQSIGAELLVDVRFAPFSRRNPQFNRPDLSDALEAAGIAYRHLPDLGGRREARPGPSPNDALPVGAFRNYADYAGGPAFKEMIAKLIAASEKRRTVVMCAEADWRHCHRRIITDHLLSYGQEVLHISPSASCERAALDPLCLVEGPGKVSYPARQGDLF